MDAVVIEPSPLARNVYRLLWQQLAPQGRLVAVSHIADLARLDTDDVEQPTLVIGSGALLSDFGRRDWQRWLLDDPVWSVRPKIVLFLDQDSADLAPMHQLQHTQWLKRPFRVEQFLQRATGGTA